MTEIEPEKIDRRDRAAQRHAEAALRQEQEQQRRERERALFEHLQSGGRTGRQQVAADRVAYLRSLATGRWACHNEAWVSRGTATFGRDALRAVERAASEAVASALEPLIEAAEQEVRGAAAERDEILAGKKRR